MPTNRETRREQLLDAASRAVAEHGPDVTMEAMASEAGITKPILYRHFGDKGGLYRAIAARYVDRLMAELEAALATVDDPRERIAATIDAYLSLIEREPTSYRFLMRRAIADQPEARAFLTGFQHRVAERLIEVLRPEFERFGIPTTGVGAYAHGLVGLVQQAGDWWLDQADLERASLVDQLSRWVWTGFVGLTPRDPR
ncbi:MAG TPA: TetR family transcriptional regulator [Nitriliruptorales bacterium]